MHTSDTMNDGVVVIDDETYEYVIDKGPLTGFAVTETGELQSFNSLRVFGLRKGYTEFAELPGHYFSNQWTGVDATYVQCLQAPSIVHFKDKGNAPAFVLEWKTKNEKLYAMTLPTAVKISSGNDPDKRDKWLTATDIKPVRLALLESIQPVEDRDGAPLKKNLEAWLANHSGKFWAGLKLTTTAALRKWCTPESFEKNVDEVGKFVQTAFEQSVKESCRGGEAAQMQNTIAKQLPAFLRMTDCVRQHVKLIAVPLSHRFVELNIEPEFGVEDMSTVIARQLGRGQNSAKAELLFEKLKMGDKFTLMQEGRSRSLDYVISPFQCDADVGEKRAPANNDDKDDENIEATVRALDFNLNEPAAPGAARAALETPDVVGVLPEKRLRARKTPFDDSTNMGDEKVKKPKADEASTNLQTEAVCPKRAYKKTGMYSKNPVKAAIAHEKKKMVVGVSLEQKVDVSSLTSGDI